MFLFQYQKNCYYNFVAINIKIKWQINTDSRLSRQRESFWRRWILKYYIVYRLQFTTIFVHISFVVLIYTPHDISTLNHLIKRSRTRSRRNLVHLCQLFFFIWNNWVIIQIFLRQKYFHLTDYEFAPHIMLLHNCYAIYSCIQNEQNSMYRKIRENDVSLYKSVILHIIMHLIVFIFDSRFRYHVLIFSCIRIRNREIEIHSESTRFIVFSYYGIPFVSFKVRSWRF